MNKKLRAALLVLLAAVFLTSAAMLLLRLREYRAGEETYAEAGRLAGLDLPEMEPDLEPDASSGAPPDASAPRPVYVDPYAGALAAMDFTALREANPDVLGWILIPNTKISYPLVQGDDNQFYLNHTWKKWSSAVGAIFLECTNRPDFSDFNTLVYGHRMNNGSMFAGLKYYKQQSYYKAHPSVYVTDDAGARKYEIFAAYEVSTQGSAYRVGFSSDRGKQEFLDDCLSLSLYDTGVVPTVNDRILTLSTCTGNGHATRWVVQARLPGAAPEGEAVPEEETAPEEAPPTAVPPADAPEAPPSADPPSDGLPAASASDPAASAAGAASVPDASVPGAASVPDASVPGAASDPAASVPDASAAGTASVPDASGPVPDASGSADPDASRG